MGVGDSWGTREELLHPRDSKGRFRSKWKMSKAATDRVLGILAGFAPKTWSSDADAATYLSGVAGKGKKKLPLDQYAQIQKDLRAGKDSPGAKQLRAAEAPTPEDLIVSSVVGPEAFGLTPETIGQVEEYTGKLVADKGFRAGNVGTPIPHGAGQITLVMAVPKGTRAVIPGGGSREVILTDEQPLRITKVDPDGQGGFYVLATAMPIGTAGNVRTKKLGTRAPTPTDPDGDGVPGVASPAPGIPVDPNAPAPRVEELQSPSVGGDGGTPGTEQGVPGVPPTDQPSTSPEGGKAGVSPPADAKPSEPAPAPDAPADVPPEMDAEVRQMAAEILANRMARQAGGGQKAGQGKEDLSDEAVQGRVLDATQRLAERPGGWVPITLLREDLGDLPREQVDKALKEIALADPDFLIISEADQSSLTQRDRDSAIRMGGEDKHLVAHAGKDSGPAPAKKATKKAAPGGTRVDRSTDDALTQVKRQVAEDRAAKAAPAKAAPAKAAPAKAAPAKAAKKAAPAASKLSARDTGDIDRATIPELRQIAKDEGLRVPAKLTRKQQIKDFIAEQRRRDADAGIKPPTPEPAKAPTKRTSATSVGRSAVDGPSNLNPDVDLPEGLGGGQGTFRELRDKAEAAGIQIPLAVNSPKEVRAFIDKELERRKVRDEGKLAPGDVVIQMEPDDIPVVIEAPADIVEATKRTTIPEIRQQAKDLGITVPAKLTNKTEIMKYITQQLAMKEMDVRLPGSTPAKKGAPKVKPQPVPIGLAPFTEGIDPKVLGMRPGILEGLLRNLNDPETTPRKAGERFRLGIQTFADSIAINPGTDKALTVRDQKWIEAMRLIADRISAYRRPSTPAVARVRRSEGRDLTDWVATSPEFKPVAGRRPLSSVATPGDPMLTRIAREQGWMEPAGVGTSDELDRAIREDGWTEVWRGALDYPGQGNAKAKSARDQFAEMRTSPDFVLGRGVYGNGIYTSTGRRPADMYASPEAHDTEWQTGDEGGAVIRMAIDPKAKVGDYDELVKEWKRFSNIVQRKHGRDAEFVVTDFGRWAAMKGYDVIFIDKHHGDGAITLDGDFGEEREFDQYMILNRTAVLMEDQP